MSEMSAEKFAQRVFDLGLLDHTQIEAVWSELGTRNVSSEAFRNQLLRKELLTNWQIERILSGERQGYMYGKYKVLYNIGTGTFARVYRAVNVDDGKVMAVKVLRRRFRDDPAQMDQFMREGKMGADLRHPNIVSIYKVDIHRDAPYMVMDFVEGRNLRDFVNVRKSFDPITATKLIIDIASGLAYAAEKGITHRDLKMSNVLVTSTGRAKLVDFGLAAARGNTDDEIVDSPNARAIDYAALERGTGVRKDDPRSDIYFAGCIYYNMLTGKPPLTETRDRMQRLNVTRFHQVPPIQEVLPELPHFVAQMVSKAMSLNPDERYQTPAAMLAELKLTMERLKGGAEARDEGTYAKQADVKDVLEGTSHTIMIVESNMQLQDELRERLKKRGYRVLITNSPMRALERFDQDESVADCILFSAPDIGVEALEAFNRFGIDEHTRNIPAILLADERQGYVFRDAKLADHRVILKMPLKVRLLRAMLKKLLTPVKS